MIEAKKMRLEGWGLILILASFLWQLIETDLQNASQEIENYKIHQKLDAIWTLQTNEYAHSPLNETQISSWINFEHLWKDWKYYGQDKKKYEDLNNQLKWASYIRIFIFVMGSVLLIIPKFIHSTN